MKLQASMTQIELSPEECKFLTNVLLDWDQTVKQPTKQEKKMWEHLITLVDPYLQK
jgi:hypothetical protein